MTLASVRTRLATDVDIPAALRVWEQSNVARGIHPSQARIAQVRAKLADPEALLVIAFDGGDVIGLALAEPGRDLDGAGDLLPELCHISLVFVRPDRWGQRTGVSLLDAIAAHALDRGHQQLQLWTRETNHHAQRLYHRVGFRPTSRTSALPDGDTILHFLRTTGV